MSFWQQLDRPFGCLAPMEDVTDTVFRQMIVKLGKPEVMFTEFVNIEAIVHEKGGQRLMFSESERPIVAQIWGNRPESFYKAAQTVAKLGFDGVDVNLGCPQRKIVQTGGCSALIGENKLVGEIVQACKEGSGLPVSVKTRIGRRKIVTEEWCGFLLGLPIAALTVHCRTAEEMSKVPAHWEELDKLTKLRKNSNVRVIGNGDVGSWREAVEKCQRYQVDGVMIGRGALHNPKVFNRVSDEMETGDRLTMLDQHLRLWRTTWGSQKNFSVFKKYLKVYVNGFDGAAQMREMLMVAADEGTLENQLVQLRHQAGT